ncbi:molybdate ABC transporter substrate-binding protein [Persicitalea jodogahamensis]|uniref:Molybdate ABC transporter substrate-binding protein n=1 Tax=Persicitalea jodogahamensis TaxID=402147 RepID=A0A8J3GA98_9BACT|nr:molybdate ABC transporter substrate-binding protein [Persicitalea jodogahamensis]GHB79490.1 molybdate ABC transporter substrate-binding protein [Persicitalea jodogahamensis]
MRKFGFKATLIGVGVLLVVACSRPNDKVVVATAANVQFVMQALQKEFEKQTDTRLEIVVGSSGKLTAQIREGAPFDLFVSADTRYPQEIFDNGGAETRPRVYARGALVLWASDSTITPDIQRLADPEIKKIALANPETAPYGTAAVQVLNKAGLYNQVKSKLVYGESIAQTTQYIAAGAAEMGFTALSMVLSPEIKGQGRWSELDSADYSPINQAAILLKHSESSPKKQKSQEFYDFLYSEQAKALFRKYGYWVE